MRAYLLKHQWTRHVFKGPVHSHVGHVDLFVRDVNLVHQSLQNFLRPVNSSLLDLQHTTVRKTSQRIITMTVHAKMLIKISIFRIEF